ncbi:hypothetical protein HPB51_012620 [Rhipicephalus microplus]|uniref:Uncharacterized protein n=1 Tax=Rhipicephalus microplus TaxID=6941 RepID=A0A9J6E1C3_RHIMP|nr:hypothetical protein HPB51_012620 [Rhipicephalus microplus]
MASLVSTIESAAIDAADTSEYPVDPDDGSWFTATRRRKPKTAMNSAPEPLPAENQVTPRPSPLPVDDFKVIFLPRGGFRLSEWAHHMLACAVCMTAGLPGETVNKLLFCIQGERIIAIASTLDETIATKLQAVTALNLGSQRYEMQAAPDNSCKVVIIGPEKNTSPTELLDNIYAPDAVVLHARIWNPPTRR